VNKIIAPQALGLGFLEKLAVPMFKGTVFFVISSNYRLRIARSKYNNPFIRTLYQSRLQTSRVKFKPMANSFQLSSSQTALALVLPDELCQGVNEFRRKHDKAYGKWPAHINILYPFIPSHRLEAALELLLKCLADDVRGKIEINCDELGLFKHKKSGTLFLQPDEQSTDRLSKLRRSLTAALGCKESDGTHDGEFRPHMTLGQSDLSQQARASLQIKAQDLVGLKWGSAFLTVLKRDGPGGPMSIVGELPFGTYASTSIKAPVAGWKYCFQFKDHSGWHQSSESGNITSNKDVLVTSINIMEEEFAPDFAERLPIIVKTLDRLQYTVNDEPRVLCLQEVSPKTLPLILQDATIRQMYPFSTHAPTSLLPSTRNQITLASRPFLHFNLQFAEMHKAVSVVQLVGSSVSIANIHLSSGLNDESIETKRRQMSKLSAFLARRNLMDHVILAGDFNLPTSSKTLQTVVNKGIVSAEGVRKLQNDVISKDWEDAFVASHKSYQDDSDDDLYPGEEGATFDRLDNTLAALNDRAPIDNRPQRYDRILIRKDGALELKKYFMATLATRNGKFASDHYGITAIFHQGQQKLRTDPDRSNIVKYQQIRNHQNKGSDDSEIGQWEHINIINDETDVGLLIEKALPSDEDRLQREEALAVVKRVLNTDNSLPDVSLISIGSYAMGTYFSSSDIDILATGSASPDVFFNFAKTQLANIKSDEQKPQSSSNSTSTLLINSKVPILEVEVNGIKLDIQYRQNDANSLAGELSFNTHRDTEYLLASIPKIDAFRESHRFISLFLRRRGLYSAKFGYLGGIHLALMLNRSIKLMANQLGHDALSSASIIRTFFNYYASFNWSTRIVVDPSLVEESTRKADRQSPVFIRSLFTPSTRLNVSESCSVFSVNTITREFTAAREALERGEWQWCLRSLSDGVSDFLNNADMFIQVQLDLWSPSSTPASVVRGMSGVVESKLVHVPNKLSPDTAVDIDVQIWPARFREHQPEEGGKMTGYYLISISGRKIEGVEERTALDSKKLAQVAGSLSSVIVRSRAWEHTVAGLQCTVVPKKRVLEHGFVPDDRDWLTCAAADHESINASAAAEYDNTASQFSSQKAINNSNNNNNAPVASTDHTQPGPTRSLRPVQDIIARINHDTDSYNVNDFIVGYDDRFEGTMEIPLAAWKRDATHEEFIPLHRIVWIRRKHGGEKVWDRHTRLDKVFGSGRVEN
jgi:2'-5' RNA ligase/endonuclease/exonuclease/phosphatase family metal-dependent hydrolase/uncharacterized protein (UPF0248 family)